MNMIMILSNAMGCLGSLLIYSNLYPTKDSFEQKVSRDYVDKHEFDCGSEDENNSNEENEQEKQNIYDQEEQNINNQELLRECIFNERKKQLSIILIILSFIFSLVDCLHIPIKSFLIFLLIVAIIFILYFTVRKASKNEKLDKYWGEIHKIDK